MTAWAIDALIGTSVMLLLVLAARRPVAHLFGAGWAYALWLLPLLRLVMPPIDLFGGAVAAALPQYTVIVLPAAAGAAAATPAPSSGLIDWLPLLLALWGGGAAVFVMWQQSAYGAFLLSLGRQCTPADPPSHGGIKVVESGAVDGPLAVGLLDRRIVVPLDFASRYRPAERRLALDHELIHHRRFDIGWNYVALAVLAVNWFNPIAWIAFRAFRCDQELACDATVAQQISADQRLDYAFALVKSASRPGEIAACPLNRADQLKRRLRMMKQHRTSRARSAGGMGAVAALLGGGLALGSPGFAQQERLPEPRVIMAQGVAGPVLTSREIGVLRSKCGAGNWESRARVRTGGEPRVIVCGGGRADADPEVRAIMALAEERSAAAPAAAAVAAVAAPVALASEANLRMAAAPARPARPAAWIAPPAPPALPRPPVDLGRRISLQVEKQLAQLHGFTGPGSVHLAHLDLKPVRLALGSLRVAGLGAEHRAEIEAGIAEARREAAEAAAEARAEALEAAAEARRDAAEAVAEARAEALEAAAEARAEAAESAAEGRRAAAEGRRAAAEGRRAAAEGLRAAAEARAEAQAALRYD